MTATSPPQPARENAAETCVCVVSYNSADFIAECLSSLREQQGEHPHRVIVIDNASSDGSVRAATTADPDAQVTRSPENIGFGRANNLALSDGEERYVALVNPDCRLGKGALRCAVDYLREHPRVGVLGARLIDADGRDTTVDRLFTSPWREVTGLIDSASWLRVRIAIGEWWWRLLRRGPARPAEWVIGAFMVLPRRVWDAAGGFDPDFFMYGEDTNLCWRVRRLGFRVAIHPGVEVVHLGNRSAGPAYGSGRRERQLRAQVLAYTKRSNPSGARRLLRAMRLKLRAKLALLSLRARLLGDEAAERRLKRPLATLAIVDRLIADLE